MKSSFTRKHRLYDERLFPRPDNDIGLLDVSVEYLLVLAATKYALFLLKLVIVKLLFAPYILML